MGERIYSCDIGSLPFEGDFNRFLKDQEYFQQKLVESFIDKVNTGIDIPIYPQYRDMCEMFIEMINGVEKIGNFYYLIEQPTLRYKQIPEVAVLKKQAKLITETANKPVQLGVCITGPYTLAYLFGDRSPDVFELLGTGIKKIAKNNIFKRRNFETKLFTLDEPLGKHISPS